MRKINVQQITKKISESVYQINTKLSADVVAGIKQSLEQEISEIGKSTLKKILQNAEIASKEKIPICQDTGTAIVFLDIGQDIFFTGGNLYTAIQKGISLGYKKLRKSIVSDPLQRKNTGNNLPGVIHSRIVPGNKLTIHVLAKGGGAENKSKLKMFRPTATIEEIKGFVINTIKEAGAAACPPLVIGLGIGGTFELCPLLAKRALLRKFGSKNKNTFYAELEQQLLAEINKLNIGPAGYGGKTTALAVHIETHPCHIASLPVAVNIQCHADRYKKLAL